MSKNGISWQDWELCISPEGMARLKYYENLPPEEPREELSESEAAMLAGLTAAAKRVNARSKTMATYSEEDAREAPLGTIRVAGSDVDIVAYRINATDLCLLANKNGQCIYRATLAGALDPNLVPHISPLVDDTFVVRDLAAFGRLVGDLIQRTP